MLDKIQNYVESHTDAVLAGWTSEKLDFDEETDLYESKLDGYQKKKQKRAGSQQSAKERKVAAPRVRNRCVEN